MPSHTILQGCDSAYLPILELTNKVKLGILAVTDGKLRQLKQYFYIYEPWTESFIQEEQKCRNPYMSDVYSLGMTFLYVARIEPPIKVRTCD